MSVDIKRRVGNNACRPTIEYGVKTTSLALLIVSLRFSLRIWYRLTIRVEYRLMNA